MITCNILGLSPDSYGLGNQLFCVATTLGLAYENNDTATFPELNKPPYDFYGRNIFHKLNRAPIDISETYHEPPYTSTIYKKMPYKKNLCIRGHFQSYKYFHEYREKIIDMLQLPPHMASSIEKRYKDLLKNSSNMVSIHVRRADYLKYSDRYTILDKQYYQAALDLQDKNEIVVFSDDIEWCKENLSFAGKKMHFVENEMDVIDMFLMSKMKNNIIANSTFSWWAAYMNTNENKKVIAPKEWFGPARTKSNEVEIKDLIPLNWIRI